MTDITVPVPDERTAEFYQFFGLWLAGSLSLHPLATKGATGLAKPSESSEPSEFEPKPWANTEEDVADATELWKKLTPRARGLFGMLMDNPGVEFTGQQIADALNIPHGAYGVAGALGYPGRYVYAMGRPLPSSWREDSETLESFYSMSGDTADLFKAVRAKAQGATE